MRTEMYIYVPAYINLRTQHMHESLLEGCQKSGDIDIYFFPWTCSPF